jgi:hypothetical protein
MRRPSLAPCLAAAGQPREVASRSAPRASPDWTAARCRGLLRTLPDLSAPTHEQERTTGENAYSLAAAIRAAASAWRCSRSLAAVA